MTRRRLASALAVATALFAAAPAAAVAAPPAGVTGVALDGRVELAWQPVAGASGYKVYRGATATTVTTPLMVDPLSPPDITAAVSFTDIGAVNGTTYYYAVRAITAGVESANSRVVRVTPLGRTCSGANAVVQENCFPGTADWDVDLAAGVDGYATAQSINRGGSVDLKVQAAGASAVDLEIFRSGDYGGAGARLFSTLVDVPVGTQPACLNDPAMGLYDCSGWTVTQTLTTTATWPSGVYLIRVTRKDTGRQTHILLVVRDDDRHSDVLFGVPTSTYQAYNYFGGRSTYDNKSTGANTVAGTPRAVKVSYDRPYIQPHDDAVNDWYTRSDFATVRWLERSGYDVAYAAVDDFERNGARIRDHRAFISGTHDEYYSSAMRTALEAAREAGTDLFFTGANEVFWKTRFEPSPVTARQDRVLVSYKSTQSGGPDPSGIPTGTWRDAAGANLPENALAGGMYIGEQTVNFFPLRVSALEGKDRIWRNTGLENQPAGTSTNVGAQLVGWEWDARFSNGREPAGTTTLASSPVTGRVLQPGAGLNYITGPALSNASKYSWPSGALIVSTGTNQWNWGLAQIADGRGEPDRRIQQATTNVLVDMGAIPETPASNLVLDDPLAPPLVTLKQPSANATGVDPGAVVRATFSRPMDPATITASTVRLRLPDGTPVPASVSYNAVSFTATLTPSSPLALETTYSVNLDPAIRAANGIALAAAQSWSFTTRPPDRTPPSVAITAPANGGTVISQVDVTAAASDDSAVAGVQFKLDGNNLGVEDTSAPYLYSWDARSVSAGSHRLTAVARDTSGNVATSIPVDVTVDPTGLVAAFGFEETSGTTTNDSSGRANGGALSGATRSLSGRFGRALSFDGVNDWVTVADASSLDLTTAMTLEAWVNPAAAQGTSWRTVLMKEQATGLAYGLYANSSTSRPSAHVYTAFEDDTRGTAQVAASTWTHLAVTYDGATLRLYVNGAQVSSKAVTGALINSTGALHIGGNAVWGEHFAGLIDEVRVYRRVLPAPEIQSDMSTAIVAPDSQAPGAPGGLTAAGGVGQVRLDWTAASDNVGVTRYNVHRGATTGFTPTPANRIAQPTGLSYTDTGVAAGDWYYRVIAEDAAGNTGPASGEAGGTATADASAPTVSLTAPAAGATLSGNVNLTATATDNVAVAGVQFKLDGANLGAEDASAPYLLAWDTRTATPGTHTLTAEARDGAGNRTTAQTVSVTVDNPPVDLSGLVGAWGFEEAAGSTAVDSSTRANSGTLAGTTRTPAGRFGAALTFDGATDLVTVPDADSLDLNTAMTLEAWVRPSALTNWRTVLAKEQTTGLSYGLYANGSTNRPSAHANVNGEVDIRGTAQLPVDTWSHLAATYDGATLRLYVNGTEVSSQPLTGSLVSTTGALRIGGNSFAGEHFAGQIDEVRVYQRSLTAGELQIDMNAPVVSTDAQAPTAPGGLTAVGGVGQAQLSWTAATDNVGVTRYNLHRSSAAGFTPGSANRIAQPAGLTYTDTGVTPGTWYYRVTAQDAAGNVGPASGQATAVATADTTAPTVSLTAPATGATLTGTVNLSATAGDNVAVAGVQFKLDGVDLGAEDTAAPYTWAWDTVAVANGPHTLTGVARDAASNRTTAQTINVTVDNPPIDTTGLVGAWGFEEAAGSAVTDGSSSANNGTISGAGRTDGRFGSALDFDGVNDLVTVPDTASLDLSDAMTLEAWVRPTANAGWRTAVLKGRGTNDLAYGIYSSAFSDRPSGHLYTSGEQDTRGTAELALNTWTHLATTWDGTTLRLYVNGTQVSSKAVAGTIGATTQPLQFGGNTIWGEYFKGSLDEIRVYRRALSAAQVQTDMVTAVRSDAPPPAGPETRGEFSASQEWPLVPVHISMLSDGKVAVWDGFDAALNSERIWDPATGAFTPIPSGRNLFCAAHVTLPDGRMFVAGGHVAAYEGLKDTHLFDPQTRSWFRGTDMARARWYPTATTLPDGRVLVVSGDNIGLGTPGQPDPLTNGSVTLPEIYDVDTNSWTPLSAGQRRMALYPFMFQLPDGKVFDAGPDLMTRTLDTQTGQWSNVGNSPIDGHSAVMYRPGKILKSGTWGDPDFPNRVVTARAATIDMNATSPAWGEIQPMNHPRSYHTLTSLLDGTVLATGGSTASDGIDQSKAVLSAELWDPVTGNWTKMASGLNPRLYHSSSMLLPDGRVLLAGGGAFGAAINEANAEIFSPPYLFKGPRPTITTAPATLAYGASFSLATPDASRIQSVSLVRMGSVTHNFDMDQRFMQLAVRPGGTSGTLEIDAPQDANLAPPGYYYVAVVDDNGVPSKGSILKIDPPGADTEAPTVPGGLSAVATDDDIRVDWTASTDNTAVTGYRVHRSTTAGFTPSSANRIATVTSGTAYDDRDLAAGTYHYAIVAVDAAGNASAPSNQASAAVAPDTTLPTVSLTAPSAGATVGGTVPIDATAADNRSVASVQFRLDGNDLGAPDTTAPYTASWDTRTAPNGSHQLTAVARDLAGNARTSAAVGVTVDNGTPPTVSLTAPLGGATVSGTTGIAATAADDRGITSVQFKLDGADLGAADTAAPYSVNWDTRTVPNGVHTLTAVARDTDGSTTTSGAVQVTVDNPVTGLVAAYGFEELTGTAVTDSSGTGNAGTISGATRSASGRFGQALSFDAINDMVSVPDASSLDLTTGMTLEAWVRPTSTSGWQTVLMKERTGGLAYGAYSNSATNRPSVHVDTAGEDDTRGTAQLPANTWSHLAATYDGATLRIFVNGVQASSKAVTGAIVTSTGALRIGGNAVWPEWFGGLIDEVRIYRQALTGTEIQQDMSTAVNPAALDGVAPGAPGGLSATGGVGAVALSWSAASDNVGVTRYNVHRGATAGFTPSPGNRVAQVSGLSHTDSGLPAGSYFYRVTAEDAAGNVGPAGGEASATATADTVAPAVSITAPAGGATVFGSLDLTAAATDAVGVAGVQFRVDGADLGAEDASGPYTRTWDTASVPNGSHTITAVARDAAGNRTTSAPVTVTVANQAVDPTGLIAAFGFEETSATTATDSSGSGSNGTLTGATRSTSGRFGSALSLDGVNDWLTVPDANPFDLTTGMTLEAWVRPTAVTGWQTVLMKEQAGGLVYSLYSNTNTSRPSAHVHTSVELDTRGTAQLAANTWAHLTATYDGATLRLYVNGVQASTAPASGSIVASTGALRVGGNNVWPEWFGGLIDEVRVYRRALSSSEVQADMNRAVVPGS